MSADPGEGLAGLLVLVVVAAVWAAMWWGWRRRARSQADLLEPHWLGTDPAVDDAVRCGYVGTTVAGDWLDRVTAHGLGVRGPARLVEGGAGLLVLRPGARGFSIARADLLDVRCAAGIANRLAPRHLGVVVVTWRLGERELDTGFQPRDAADRDRIEQLVTRLVHQEEATP